MKEFIEKYTENTPGTLNRFDRIRFIGIGLMAACWPYCSNATLAASAFEKSHTTADRWPGWRGDGSGTSPSSQAPLQWDADTGIAWKTRIAGEGISSPIVWEDRVFLTAAVERGAVRLVVCLHAGSGDVLWHKRLPAEATPTYPRTGHAAPTPVTDGERVYAFLDSPGLVAVDVEGNLAWQVDLGPFKNSYNMASSPVLAGDLVVLVCDHQDASFIAAFDRRTGEERWRTQRDGGLHYATPLFFVDEGQAQIVANAQTIISYEASTGTPLWWTGGMKHATTPSPVYLDGRVYVTSGRNGPSMAIAPDGRGDIAESHVVYHLPSGGPYVPSPLVYQGLFIIPGDDGRIMVVEDDGRVRLRTRVRSRFTASPLLAADRLYWCDERGTTTVFDLSELNAEVPALPPVATNPLDPEPCLASPALAGARLYVRTAKYLYCIAGGDVEPGSPTRPTLPDEFPDLKELYLAQKTGEFDDTMLRLDIVEKVSRLDHPGVVDLLAHMVHRDGHWDVCEAALRELGRQGEDAVPALCGMFEKGQPFYKTVAAEHLAEIRSPDAVPSLMTGTRDGDLQVRITSIRAVTLTAAAHKQAAPEVAEALIALVGDEHGLVRKAAIDGLVRMADVLGVHRGVAIEAIASRANDENSLTAKAARLALRRLLSSEVLYKAEPVTPPGWFTTGIEGPACDRAGNIYAVNFREQGTVGRVTPTGNGEVFLRLPEGSVGNGIRFDKAGNMFVADYPKHNVLRIDAATGTVSVFAHEPAMNQPNDLAIDADGNLYASDPDWSTGTGRLWRISAQGNVTLLDDDMGTTNGIEVSPDGKTLYVNESVQRNLWAFDIGGDGSLTNKRLLKKFDDHGFDGMRCDVAGNLYVTRYGKGTVVILNPRGEVLREVEVLGKKPSNLCFGGPDGRTVYVTEVEHRRLVAFRTAYPGLSFIVNRRRAPDAASGFPRADDG